MLSVIGAPPCALTELTECCSSLDGAIRAAQVEPLPIPPRGLADAFETLATQGKADDLLAVVRALTEELAEARTRASTLEERLARLEGAAADFRTTEESP